MTATFTLDPDLDRLCEPWPTQALAPLDRDTPAGMTPLQQQWHSEGFVILPGLADLALVDRYAIAWQVHNVNRLGGWPYATPYMDCGELLDLCSQHEIHAALLELFGEPMGVHLNLTGWRSTQRNWHQDGYLNPDHVADWYAAVWIALDDIHPDSGPFQYVPGSHRWPIIRQDRMLAALTAEERHSPQWPAHSERILTPAFEEKLQREGHEVREFIAKRGDVLIWHARLLHRGSRPRNPNIERRALIAHYSGISHRRDMPPAVQHRGGWYFPLGGRQPVS